MIVKPGFFLLTLFGVFALFTILILFYLLSFPFLTLFELYSIIYVCLPIIFFSLITLLIDLKYKTKFIRYAFAAITSLIISYLIFPTIKSYIIKNTEARGDVLIKSILKYKQKYGYYPKSIEESYFNNVPKIAIIHRQFFYKLSSPEEKNFSFKIYCRSFDGLEVSKYYPNGGWYYSD